eukprot:843263-Pelagomonas_calceolata.AAC.3
MSRKTSESSRRPSTIKSQPAWSQASPALPSAGLQAQWRSSASNLPAPKQILQKKRKEKAT